MDSKTTARRQRGQYTTLTVDQLLELREARKELLLEWQEKPDKTKLERRKDNNRFVLHWAKEFGCGYNTIRRAVSRFAIEKTDADPKAGGA